MDRRLKGTTPKFFSAQIVFPSFNGNLYLLYKKRTT